MTLPAALKYARPLLAVLVAAGLVAGFAVKLVELSAWSNVIWAAVTVPVLLAGERDRQQPAARRCRARHRGGPVDDGGAAGRGRARRLGQARIVDIRVADGMTADELLAIAASLDQASKHIIAQTIVAEARAKGLTLAIPTEVVETPGEGMVGWVEGRRIVVGGLHFVASQVAGSAGSLIGRKRPPGALASAVAVDGKLVGLLILSDALRAGTEEFLRALRALGIERIVLATGDRHEVARFFSAGLSLDMVRSDLTPTRKCWWCCPSVRTARS